MNMTFKRFQKLVSSYGTEVSRWPEAERDAALEVLKTDERAAALFQSASGLDAALLNLPDPAPADEAYLKRLATIPFASRSLGEASETTFGEFMRGFFPSRRMVPQGLGLAAMAALGLWLGFSAPATGDETIQLDPTQYFLENPDLAKDFEDLR